VEANTEAIVRLAWSRVLRVDNEPSRRVAAALGYQEVGSRTTVLLPTA
jgi:hypothetical protein